MPVICGLRNIFNGENGNDLFWGSDSVLSLLPLLPLMDNIHDTLSACAGCVSHLRAFCARVPSAR